MSDTRDQDRAARMKEALNTDGTVTPPADLPPGMLTPEGLGGLKGDVTAALADDHASNAGRRGAINTAQAFDRTVAELLSRTNTDGISEAAWLRDKVSAAKPIARSYRYFGLQADAGRPLLLLEHPMPIATEQKRRTEMSLDDLLLETFGSREAAEAWLDTPNLALAGETPVSCMCRSDHLAIRQLLLMTSTGMPT